MTELQTWKYLKEAFSNVKKDPCSNALWGVKLYDYMYTYGLCGVTDDLKRSGKISNSIYHKIMKKIDRRINQCSVLWGYMAECNLEGAKVRVKFCEDRIKILKNRVSKIKNKK